MGQAKFDDLPHFALNLMKIQNDDQVKRAVDAIIKFQKAIPADQKKEINGLINENILKPIADRKEAEGLKEQADYIRSKIDQQ
jgi:hypothetical protein